MVFHGIGHHHADKSRYGTDGNIDPGRNHGQCFAHGDNDKPGIVNEKVEEHLGLCKSGSAEEDHSGNIHGNKKKNRNHEKEERAVQASCTFFHFTAPPFAAAEGTAVLLFPRPLAHFWKTGLWKMTIITTTTAL